LQQRLKANSFAAVNLNTPPPNVKDRRDFPPAAARRAAQPVPPGAKPQLQDLGREGVGLPGAAMTIAATRASTV
jgi:hypothetical protein